MRYQAIPHPRDHGQVGVGPLYTQILLLVFDLKTSDEKMK